MEVLYKNFYCRNRQSCKICDRKATMAGHTVYFGSCHLDNIVKTDNCKPVFFDLHAERNEIEKQIYGFEAIYFLAEVLL